jgi:hypothetical protein
MEWWSNGVMLKLEEQSCSIILPNTPALQYSNTPILRNYSHNHSAGRAANSHHSQRRPSDVLKLNGDNAPLMGMISESRDAVRQCPSVKNHLITY